MGAGKMSEVRVLEIILPLLPQYISRKTVEHACETGWVRPSSLWFVYEGGYYVVLLNQNIRSSWFKPCTVPAPAGAEAYGLTLWELSK